MKPLIILVAAGLAWPLCASAEPLVALESGAELQAPSAAAAPETEDTASPSDGLACEVLSIEGTAFVTRGGGRQPLTEGDLVSANETVDVSAGGSVDLGFDGGWQNIVRLEGGAQASVRSVLPGRVALKKAALYARLQELPEGSTFQVETPTAIASVRGTEYRAVVAEDGSTDISNFSDSPVYVSGLGGEGIPTVLARSQITQITRPGLPPSPARRMTDAETRAGQGIREGIGRKIEGARRQGRVGRIQKVQDLRRIARVENPRAGQLRRERPAGNPRVAEAPRQKTTVSEQTRRPGAQRQRPPRDRQK